MQDLKRLQVQSVYRLAAEDPNGGRVLERYMGVMFRERDAFFDLKEPTLPNLLLKMQVDAEVERVVNAVNFAALWRHNGDNEAATAWFDYALGKLRDFETILLEMRKEDRNAGRK